MQACPGCMRGDPRFPKGQVRPLVQTGGVPKGLPASTTDDPASTGPQLPAGVPAETQADIAATCAEVAREAGGGGMGMALLFMRAKARSAIVCMGNAVEWTVRSA